MPLPWLVAWMASLFLLSCLLISGAAASGETPWTTSAPELPAPSPPREAQLPSPQNVQFKAILFYHILHWEPGQNQTQNIVYEVQYKRYGDSWKTVPNCTRIPHLTCDLTLPTLDLEDNTYWARVRAIAGHQMSKWTRTDGRFAKEDVILRIDHLKLQLSGNTILGEILPARPPLANGNISYESLFKHYREYELCITNVLENDTSCQKSWKINSQKFLLPVPEAGMICIKVKPVIRSSINEGLWSEKKCITVTKPFCIAVCYLSIRLYLRKPKKPPEVLLSLTKQRSCGILSKESFKVKQDIICPLDEATFPKVSLELKNSELHSSTDSGFSSTKQSLQSEDPQFLLPVLEPITSGTSEERSPHQPKSDLSTSSTSTSSTDSGIYLHNPNPQTGQEWRQQPGTGDQGQEDSGIGLPQSAIATPLGSSHGLQYNRGSTALEGNSSPSKLPEEEAEASVAFQGYLQQSRCTKKSQEETTSLGEDPSHIGSPGYKCRTHRDVELGWPPLAQTKGYLKQNSAGQSLGILEALPNQWIEPAEEWSLLSLANNGDLKTFDMPDLPLLSFPTAPTTPGNLNSDLLTLPLISSLHTNE
ncbi:interleukin-10 receptor subunit alpha isoform X2 [Monodelphis domestica]|uniref:interleukin-10 receptor subunit alpha isoform X2 n=1 Tax=Monodelphis domestica TaxID=13616 RepID=UPI0007B400F9|nr:interleukin-10 receptor subunit alpha isoform X2 [Monodelphis domestica]